MKQSPRIVACVKVAILLGSNKVEASVTNVYLDFSLQKEQLHVQFVLEISIVKQLPVQYVQRALRDGLVTLEQQLRTHV